MLSEQKMKNLIDKKARETDLPKQQLYGLYALEQLLVKLNDSSYKDKLILKGGYLLATVYGLNNRVTRDLDITVRDTYLTEEMLINIADFVSTTDKNGEVHFELRGIRKTREEFDYNGYELKLLYKNGRTKFPISVDFTTGENLISIEEENSLPLMFEEEKKLNFPSYTIEQILTDKFYTIIAYGKYDDTNSRMKDYYDIYLLSTIGKNIDYYAINNGLSRIMKQRDEFIDNNEFENIISSLGKAKYQRSLWEKYKEVTPFARDLAFEDVINKLMVVSRDIISAKNINRHDTKLNKDK